MTHKDVEQVIEELKSIHPERFAGLITTEDYDDTHYKISWDGGVAVVEKDKWNNIVANSPALQSRQ